MTSAEVNILVVFYIACGCLIVGIIWHALDKAGDVAAADRAHQARLLLAAVLLLAVWPLVVLYYSTTGRKKR